MRVKNKPIVRFLSHSGSNILGEEINQIDLVKGIIDIKPIGCQGYFTVLPISKPEYRKENKTKACVRYSDMNGWMVFKIMDDYGYEYELSILKADETEPLIEKLRVDIHKYLNLSHNSRLRKNWKIVPRETLWQEKILQISKYVKR